MIGDNIELKNQHLSAGKTILPELIMSIQSSPNVYCIGIGGESGSGKSTQALAFKKLLEREGFTTIILHMDDYFLLPPKSNHQRRKKDINHVGPAEIDLQLLNENIELIKKRTTDILVKPLINYELNVIRKEFVQIQEVHVIIVEGTYTLLLDQIDCRIFLDKNYLATKIQRIKRGRDIISQFNETVLSIEHEIIRKHSRIANYIIDSNYSITATIPSSEIGPHLWV